PVNPSVGDIAYELPSYYCHLHNPDVTQYPIDPSKTLNPDYNWDGGGGNPDGGGVSPTDPGNGSDNGGGGQDDGSQLPDWIKFFN
nr:hypothetical protein [Bacillota bacterium]